MYEYTFSFVARVYPPPRAVSQAKLLPVLLKTKDAYKTWNIYHQLIPKIHRYSLAMRIDTLFIELIEALAIATFLSKEEKLPFIRLGIRKLDTLNILLLILFETKSLNAKKFITLSEMLSEIGKMLGGWYGQLSKQQEKKN